MSFKIDLHCHSRCSDGTFTPQELLHLARKNKLTGLSITDHDTLEAYTDELFLLAKELDLILLPGIELTSKINDESVHILGYKIDLKSENLNAFLLDLQQKKKERNQEILKKLKTHNILITEDELYNNFDVSKTVIGRPHIASLMFKKGYVSSIQEGFDKYLADGASCFVMGEKYSPQRIIDEIHSAKGKAVIAHPAQIKNSKIMQELVKLPFDGIEVYYSRMLLDQELKWLRLAKDKKWLITGGSDFHGTIRPHVDLGCSWVDQEAYSKLIA